MTRTWHVADSSYNHGRRVPIIGFTATFKRDDQLALSAAYEKIVFHRETRTMLNEGWWVEHTVFVRN